MMKILPQKKRRLAKERKQRWRARQTPESLAKIRLLDLDAHQKRINNMPAKELEAFNVAHANSQRLHIERLTPEQSTALRVSNAASQRRRIENFTQQQLDAHHVAHAESQRLYIERCKTRLTETRLFVGLKSGKLSDLKRVFQRVACFPCEYLTDVHKLLFMMDCDPSMIRQNIFAFRGFQFSPDSQDFKKRKNYLEYLTFHSLRKISSVLTTKSVDLRNSTKHELVTHLAEVLAEYCDKSTPSAVCPSRNYSKNTSTSPLTKYREIQPKVSVPSNNIVAEKNPPLFIDDSVVENIVVTPLIDPSITGLPDMSPTFINAVQDIPKGTTITESPLKIVETHSVVSESSSKRSSTSSYPPSKKVAIGGENSVVQKLEQCQQVYGTTVSLIPAGSGPAITGIVYSGLPQGVQYPTLAPSIVSATVSPQIVTTQATNLPIEEKHPLPSHVLQNEKTLKNPSVTCLSDDEDCDKPLSSLVGYPIDSVLEKHVDDIVKNSDLQSITINGVIKKINDMYPKFDLSYRKEFLKSTVRSLLYRLGQEKSDLKRNTDSPDCSVTTTECIDSDSKSLECQVE